MLQRHRLPRRVRNTKWFWVFFLALVTLYKADLVRLATFYAPCNDGQSNEFIQNMCNRYRSGQIDGDLCQDICTNQKLVYETCINHRGGKVVLLTNCTDMCIPGQTVLAVMKTANNNVTVPSPLYNVSHGTAERHRIMKMYLETKLASKYKVKSVVKFLTTNNMVKFPEPIFRSRLQLIQQDEYFFMLIHQNKSYIPKLYGTCGEYYMMQYIPPDLSYFPHIWTWKEAPWRDRVTVAMEIMKISKSMDLDYHETLHFCDVKIWNYGIGKNNEVKIIDTDSMHYHTELLDMMSKLNCTRDEDCDFNDCHGMCDLSTHKCLPQRSNNNLQKICQDIFKDEPKNLFGGLLHSPPKEIAQELNGAIDECASPHGYNTLFMVARRHTPFSFYHKLEKLLKKSLLPPKKLTPTADRISLIFTFFGLL